MLSGSGPVFGGTGPPGSRMLAVAQKQQVVPVAPADRRGEFRIRGESQGLADRTASFISSTHSDAGLTAICAHLPDQVAYLG